MRLIRTALFAPGINAKVMNKALASSVDAVILDLEDSVPLALKDEARKLVRETIQNAYDAKSDDVAVPNTVENCPNSCAVVRF